MKNIPLSVTFLLIFNFSLNAQLYLDHNNRKGLPTTVSTADKVYALSTIWSEIKYNFANIDRVEFDIDSLYLATIDRVLESRNDLEFYGELYKFTAAFNDGHTRIATVPYDLGAYLESVPLWFIEMGHKYYIFGIGRESGIDPGLLGAELTEIDNTPVDEYVRAKYFPEISGTENAKWFNSTFYIGSGFPGDIFSCKALKRDGTVAELSIEMNAGTSEQLYGELIQLKGIRKRWTSNVMLDWLEGDIAWLDIRRFSNEVPGLIDSLMSHVSPRAKGLIIDMRYNSGGSSVVGTHLLKYLTKGKGFMKASSQVRVNNSYGRSQGNYREEFEDFYLYRAYETTEGAFIEIDEGFDYLRIPVVILIGKETASAAETFLVELYEIEDQPLLIGEETQGCCSTPLMVPLSYYYTEDEDYDPLALVASSRPLFPESKKLFVGEGIKPDIEVCPDISCVETGYDIVLDKAIEIINGL